jgi:hypothetical protein
MVLLKPILLIYDSEKRCLACLVVCVSSTSQVCTIAAHRMRATGSTVVSLTCNAPVHVEHQVCCLLQRVLLNLECIVQVLVPREELHSTAARHGMAHHCTNSNMPCQHQSSPCHTI